MGWQKIFITGVWMRAAFAFFLSAHCARAGRRRIFNEHPQIADERSYKAFRTNEIN
jgi:hypothetical protein